jgi:hypothetical protein
MAPKKPVHTHGEPHAPEEKPGKKGKEFTRGKGAVDEGRRGFLRSVSGRHGAERGAEKAEEQPSGRADIGRRKFLGIVAGEAAAAALGIGKKARADERVASVNRLMDGGGAILSSIEVSPMTLQDFQRQIAYMFDLTSQFEVQSDSNGKYTTDEFIVRKSRGIADGVPPDAICVYARNNLDGVNSSEPLIFSPPIGDNNFRVFRFQVTDSAVVQDEVVAIITSGGVSLLYFNKVQNRYTEAGASYGPNYFGSSPKVGLEINEQDGIKYISLVAMDPSKFDSRGNPIAGAEVASISLDVAGSSVSEKAQLGAGMYKIQR